MRLLLLLAVQLTDLSFPEVRWGVGTARSLARRATADNHKTPPSMCEAIAKRTMQYAIWRLALPRAGAIYTDAS
jgi:hypothetical protein